MSVPRKTNSFYHGIDLSSPSFSFRILRVKHDIVFEFVKKTRTWRIYQYASHVPTFLQIFRDATNCSCSSCTHYYSVDSPIALSVYFRSSCFIMHFKICFVLKLICKEAAVFFRLFLSNVYIHLFVHN